MTIHADLSVQLGQEATNAWGTEVAPTCQLAGIQDITINPLVDVRLVEQLCGTRIPARQSVVPMVGGEGSLSKFASYDEVPYWLQGLFGKVTSTTDGDGLFTHDYNAPFYASDSEDAISYTLVEVDGTEALRLSGATINTLGISGESGEPLEVSVDFIGKSVATDAVVSLSCSDVVFAMGSHVSVYIDAGSDAFGGTEIANTAWSFELSVEANREVKRHLGSLTPTSYRDGKMSGELTLGLEMTASTRAYIVSVLGATKEGVEKNVRIQAVDTSSNTITIDFAGVLMGEPTLFEDMDGVNSMSLTLQGKLNTGDTNWLSIAVKNTVETLV